MNAIPTSLVVALLSPLAAIGGAPLFDRLPAEQCGIEFRNEFEENGARSFLYQSGFACGSIAIGDADGDTLPDLFFTGGAGKNALYLNKGGLRFELAPASAVLEGGTKWGSGSALVDVDNDGDLDLHLCNYAEANQLFLNDGKGNFTEKTVESGVGIVSPSLNAVFADFDRDGDLDLFLLNNVLYLPKGRPEKPPYRMENGRPVVTPEYAPYLMLLDDGNGQFSIDDYGHPDRLLLNEGVQANGVPRFRDVTVESGIRGVGHGLSATLGDFDEDGWIDVYVANDYLVPDRLWRNQGPNAEGIPQFTDTISALMPQISWSSMGADAGDLDNDGHLDLMVADMAATTHFKAKVNMGDMQGRMRTVLETGWPRQAMRNHLFWGTGVDRYQESAWFSGLAGTDWSWAVKFADFDLDGFQDIFLTNGHSRNFTDADIPFSVASLIGRTQFEVYRNADRLREPNLAFQNRGDRRFKAAPDWGIDHVGMSFAAATGDLDGDGDPDLVVANLDEEIHLYRNNATGTGRFSVRLEGTNGHRSGIGARIILTDSTGIRRTRWMTPQTGFQSQNASDLLFGLGEARAVSLEITWPSGLRQTLAIGKGETVAIVREAGTAPPEKVLPRPRFTAAMAPAFTHSERAFNDFARQPLLPGRLSRFGPCLAAGDADGDGDTDFFVGGAAGQAGALFLRDEKAGFVESPQPILGEFAKQTESVAAVWFDADGDDDLDLYVVSGSVEEEPGHLFYRDRLYLNDASGIHGGVRLTDAPEGSLPDLRDSGGCVAAADFDADGDLDLFVGSRSLVGRYPLSPDSRLLRNDGKGRFTEITDETAPGLRQCGMVTGAVWADIDADGDPDLCVSVEWGAIRIFANDGGKLTDKTEALGFAEHSGWWNCLLAADIDGDGDLDLLAGNVGWNTKYGRPEEGKIAELYYGDMDGSGVMNVIEAKHAEDRLLPVRGKSCSTLAMPALGKKFNTYRQFASEDLAGIYSPARIETAQRFTATTFASGVWINEGAAFRWLPFPGSAQFAPVNALVAADFDGDGRMEVILAQNHDGREPETGLWRGTPGTHLEWREGRFEIIPHEESGILLPADTKALLHLDGATLLAGQNNGPLLRFNRTETR